MELGFLANENLPQLKTHDRYGNRIDVATFHPSYHQLMRAAIEQGLHSLPWTNPKPGAHVVRATQMYMQNQAEAGHCCPLTMTFAAVPAINMQPDVAKVWLPKIYAKVYDPENKPWFDKQGLTIGMAMTGETGRHRCPGQHHPGYCYQCQRAWPAL